VSVDYSDKNWVESLEERMVGPTDN
jgi:hypothetical protein